MISSMRTLSNGRGRVLRTDVQVWHPPLDQWKGGDERAGDGNGVPVLGHKDAGTRNLLEGLAPLRGAARTQGGAGNIAGPTAFSRAAGLVEVEVLRRALLEPEAV